MKKNQSKRLTNQHKESKGVEGIFGVHARLHDASVGEISIVAKEQLESEFPHLNFRYRQSVSKKEINDTLREIDPDLGKTLFVASASIIPDGGFIEVQDVNNKWRVILITEAKRQGKDVENIKEGRLVGKNNDQDLMAAGNAIERSHKNIAEFANFMLRESHFPYVLFLEGSNFLTETISIIRPDERVVVLNHESGLLNRLDRLTASNYGLPINENLCVNRFIKHGKHSIMLQATSIYAQGNGEIWNPIEMLAIMKNVAITSLLVLDGYLPRDKKKE